MGRRLLTPPGFADTYTFLINTCNTLPESCQQRVYKITLATVKGQIQWVESPKPAEVIRTEAERADNASLRDYLTAKVAIEESEIESTDPWIPIDHHCPDDELHFGMPVGCADYDNAGDEIDESDAIPTDSQWWRATTAVDRFYLETSNFDGYAGDDGNDADVDEEEEPSQANDGLMQNLEEWGHRTRECEN